MGAYLGSFINVLLHRVPRGESILWPPSRCPACRQRIRWYDNIPILSYLALRGCCRACGWPIPVRYLLVELAGAAAGVIIATIAIR